MSAGKKFFWLKIKEDFFEDDIISWLEEQPNGKDYCILYLKLCLTSLKNNGIVIRSLNGILVPYDVNNLASITRTKSDTIVVALKLFERLGLVEILENGGILISKIEEMIGSETDSAARQRRRRERKKLIESESVTLSQLCHADVTPTVTPDVTRMSRKSIEIRDKRLEYRDKSKDISSSSLSSLSQECSSSNIDPEQKKIAEILVGAGVQEPSLSELLSSDNLPAAALIEKYAQEARKKLNPAGWLVKAIKEKYPRRDHTEKQYDPHCPNCGGTGKVRYQLDNGQMVETDCSCYKKYL